jgi:caffeoyl-CoA O-methyltransferase
LTTIRQTLSMAAAKPLSKLAWLRKRAVSSGWMRLLLVPPELDQYSADHSEPETPLLRELREETEREMQAAARMVVGGVEGAFLRMLVRLTGAKRILEIGMFTGYSALCMAEAMPADGELITCDINPKAEELARRFFARSEHGRKIHIRMGPALETLATLKGPLDLVFIDADKENYARYFEAALPLVRQGGLLIADNTLWNGEVLAPNSDLARAIVAFNSQTARDARVEKVQLTVRDGMTLMWKK